MKIHEYLAKQEEKIPKWLKDFKRGDSFNRDDFFSSRIVYYPGCGDDGDAVRIFGSSKSAHCFIYGEYMDGFNSQVIRDKLANEGSGFRGYKPLEIISLKEEDLVPKGWSQHISVDEFARAHKFISQGNQPFCLIAILQRVSDLNDSYGPKRLAILFLSADSSAAYVALFCQEQSRVAPFALFLQDHGFGTNYGFGKGGLMESLATRCGVFPELMVVGGGTEPWGQYEEIPDVDPDRGGLQNELRCLYRRI